MGCDIHLHQEVKVNGKWEHVANPRIKRNYCLFAKMAGVRNYQEISPISSPKGLPKDLSFFTDFDGKYWDADGHSHSWLNAEEIFLLEQWYESHIDKYAGFEFGYLLGNGWGDFWQYQNERPKKIDDVRWVFWFDN